MENNILVKADYTHIPEYSVYNHNYYRNNKTNEIILECCDDDDGFTYYSIVEEDLINGCPLKRSSVMGNAYCTFGLEGVDYEGPIVELFDY